MVDGGLCYGCLCLLRLVGVYNGCLCLWWLRAAWAGFGCGYVLFGLMAGVVALRCCGVWGWLAGVFWYRLLAGDFCLMVGV